MTSVQAPATLPERPQQKLLTHQPAVFEAVTKGGKFDWTPVIVASIVYGILAGISAMLEALGKADLPTTKEPSKTESFEPSSQQKILNRDTHVMQTEARAYELVDALMRQMNGGMLVTVIKKLPKSRPPRPDELALLARASSVELRTAMCNIAKALYTDPDSAQEMAKVLNEKLCALGWCGKMAGTMVPKEYPRVDAFMAAHEYLLLERDDGMPIDFTVLVPKNVVQLAKAQKYPIDRPPLTNAD